MQQPTSKQPTQQILVVTEQLTVTFHRQFTTSTTLNATYSVSGRLASCSWSRDLSLQHENNFAWTSSRRAGGCVV